MPLFQNEFDLYENKPVGRTHFHKNGFARTFNTEEKGSPKMAYCLRLQENEKKKTREKFGPQPLTYHKYTAVFQALKANQTAVHSQLFVMSCHRLATERI